MKSKVSPAAIGMFIAGAVFILFVSVVIFGSGQFFRKTKVFLLTFQEPVTGLKTGAPVKLLGVDIGSVQDISIGVDLNKTNSILINVLVEVDRKRAQDVFRDFPIELNNPKRFEATVKVQGLRGRLDVLSMLSGQLYIALDMFPGQEGFQLGAEVKHGYWEIPTLPSTKRQMLQSLVTSLHNVTLFDFKGTSEELKGLLVDVRTDLAKMQLGKIGNDVSEALKDVQGLLIDPTLKSAITNLDLTLGQLDELAGKLNAKANPLLADLDTDLKKAGTMLEEATETLRGLKAQVEPNSALSRELVSTLEQAGQALNSLRQLVQQIQRNPSSLITGIKETQP